MENISSTAAQVFFPEPEIQVKNNEYRQSKTLL